MERDHDGHPFRANHAKSAISSDQERAERLLFYIPMFITAALGLIYMGDRFVVVLREDLKDPGSMAGLLILAVLVASASIICVLASALIGAIIGYVLSTCFARRLGATLGRTRKNALAH